MEIFRFFEQDFNAFLLIFARVSGMLAVAPIFGSNFLQAITKAFLGFLLAIFLTGILPLPQMRLVLDQAGLFPVLIVETIVGAAIGLGAHLFFEAVLFAGYITDYQIGFGFINIVDPQSGQSISLIAFFSNMITLVFFLLIDGHHLLIQALVQSYEWVPFYGMNISGAGMEWIRRLGGGIFVLGFKLAAPMMAVMMTVDFTMGILGKTVPQLQILVVGFPVKIAIGLLAFGLGLHAMGDHILLIFEGFRDSLGWFTKALGGG